MPSTAGATIGIPPVRAVDEADLSVRQPRDEERNLQLPEEVYQMESVFPRRCHAECCVEEERMGEGPDSAVEMNRQNTLIMIRKSTVRFPETQAEEQNTSPAVRQQDQKRHKKPPPPEPPWLVGHSFPSGTWFSGSFK
jgi:hypothetical protein